MSKYREPEPFNKYMERWSDRISEVYRFFYSEGYEKGVKDTNEKLSASADGVTYVDVATEDQRKRNYCTEEDLFGWCSKCGRPLTGRWAGIAEFCPHCGRKFADKRFEETNNDI